jgi:predicted nucleotidyltransferase
MAWLTLQERKRRAAEGIARGMMALRRDLADYARMHDGRFLLYGSAVRGDYRFDSDVDIVVDFAREREAAAWRFAEEACRKHGLKPDVRPKSLCEARFVERIMRDAEDIHG